MAWPSNRWAYLLLTFLCIVGSMLLIVGLAGGPDVFGWTSSLLFPGILLLLVVPELRQPQTRGIRMLLWFTLACAALLLVGTLVEQVVT